MRHHDPQVLSVQRMLGTAILAVLLSGHLACQPVTESGNDMPQRDINTVMEAHVNELMAIPNVTGVAIGQLDDKTPCILVLIVKESNETTKSIPDDLEGHPVRVVVSGELKPMNGN